MEVKKRFKMYKAGKSWAVAPLVFFGLAAGVNLTTTDAHADVNTDDQAATPVAVETPTQGAQDNQQKQVTLDNPAPQAATKEQVTQTQAATQTQPAAQVSTNNDTKQVAKTSANPETTPAPATKDDATQATPEAPTYKQVYENKHWYLVDTKTNQKQTGFQDIKDQNKTVYYNQKGEMQYGQQYIEKNWYLFDKSSGAMQKGFQNLAPYGQNKTVYYNDQGQMQYGFQVINNNKYYFDKSSGARAQGGQKNIDGKWYLFDKNGVMQMGFQWINDQKKTVYYNDQGQMQYGFQTVGGKNYYFNTTSGAQLKAAGQQYLNGHWYLFNDKGEVKTGFQYISNQKKTVYYNDKGQMQYGQQYINGYWYLFDKSSGKVQTGFQYIKDQNKTVYYDKSNARMKYGQQYIDGHWYLFDKSSGAMQKGFQNLKAYGQDKTVYYNQDGHMLYGQQNVNGKWYLFAKGSGAMQTGFQNLAAYGQNKTVYYNNQGQMQYGFQTIDGKKMFFDRVSGAQAKGQKNIDGKWYLFNNDGVMQTGFQRIANQNKTVYYNNQGQMQYGQQYIDGHWYLFDKSTGAMRTSFRYIPEQNKTVYYNNQGQMQYGQQYIGGHWYLFDKASGAMKTGEQYIADQNKTVLYNSQGQMLYGDVDANGYHYKLNKSTGAIESKVVNKAARNTLTKQGNQVYYLDANGNRSLVGGANAYIINNNLQPVKITYGYKGRLINNGNAVNIDDVDMHYETASGKPTRVIVHETASPYSGIDNDILFELNEGENKDQGFHKAFVHAFIDGNYIYQISNPDYHAWGSGAKGNPDSVQFEQTEVHDAKSFAKQLVNAAYYTATIMKNYGMTPSVARNNGGKGTLWTHSDVSRFQGGTDHSDPDGGADGGYWGRNGQRFFGARYTLNDFYQLVQTQFNKL